MGSDAIPRLAEAGEYELWDIRGIDVRSRAHRQRLRTRRLLRCGQMYSDRNFEIRPEYRDPDTDIRRIPGVAEQEANHEFNPLALIFSIALGFALSTTLMIATGKTPKSLQPQEGTWLYQVATRNLINQNSPESREMNSFPPNQNLPQRSERSSQRPNGSEEEGGGNSPVSYAQPRTLEDRVPDHERELSQPNPVPPAGQHRVLWDLVYGADLPNKCTGVRFPISAGRTAGVYRAETGRASLDTIYGPASLGLSEGFCLDSGEVHVCVVCGGSGPVSEDLRMKLLKETADASFEALQKRHQENSEALDRHFKDMRWNSTSQHRCMSGCSPW
jgi:hypothetical protein